MGDFNVQAFLRSAGSASVVEFRRGQVIFSQGDTCQHVMYLHEGGVKLSVRSTTGQEAVVAMLGPSSFFGEGCLAGQPIRTRSATAITLSTILLVNKYKMVRLLHRQRAMADRFIEHVLARKIHMEEDLLEQLFDSIEKRLARTLLLAARYGQQGQPHRVVPKISQDALAATVGATRSQVRFFLDKFKKRGFVEDNGDFTINRSLLSVVLKA
jgi:CRP/FNR family transcriptional regulator, cyclic AMP receptor protein